VPGPLHEAAPAKVNLYLHLTGRRDDGYHLLDSLVVRAGIGDSLSAEPAATLSLRVVGPFAKALPAKRANLVLRAARALAADAAITAGARLVLDKRLPVASGIGGGSADAAAALQVLSRLWQLPPERARLLRLAGRLGADVPVCLARCPTRMRGVGEQLEPAPAVPPCGITLVNPGIALATAEVFRARRGPWSSPAMLPAAWQDAAAMAADLRVLRNDLESPAIALQPAIAGVLAALAGTPDCLLARMSGSGSTCFALFADADAAGRALTRIQRPGWWCWSGPLDEALPGTARDLFTPQPDGA
jgi:4-diphosphocytidyl-2-C-methyl-D-erythritol kinase